MNKIFKTSKKLIFIISFILLVSCDGTIHKKSILGQKNILSIDARQRIIVEGRDPVTGNKLYCAEPSPDAIVAQAASLASAFDAKLPTVPGATNKEKILKAALASNISEAASSIGVRTQTIQLMRDGYYRLCEAMINGQIGPEEYGSIVENIDGFILSMMAIEQLGGKIPVADNVAIIPNSNATVNIKQDGDIESNAKTVQKGEVTVIESKGQGGEIAKAQSQAIVDILVLYYAAKEKIDKRRRTSTQIQQRYNHPYYTRGTTTTRIH